MPAEMVDRHLPEAVLLLGQTDMPHKRIERAPRLKAIFNVETNFLPNIDYVACRDHGIWVLSKQEQCAARRVIPVRFIRPIWVTTMWIDI